MDSPAARIVLGVTAVGLYAWQAIFPVQPAGVAEQTPQQIAGEAAKVKTMIKEARYEEALRPALELSASFPQNDIYINQLADIYHQQHRPKEEAEQWERYMNVSPTPEDACPHLNHAYLTMRDRARQTASAERCVALDPKNVDLIFTLAHVREMHGDIKEARELYERGIALAPEDWDLHIGLGRVYLRQGEKKKALALALLAARKTPNDPEAFLLLGMCRYQTGQPALAHQALERGLALTDNYADLHFLLARVAQAESQDETARVHYERALQLEPDNAQARKYLADLRRPGR